MDLARFEGYEINCGSGSLGKNQTAYDAEVAAIEERIKAVANPNNRLNTYQSSPTQPLRLPG
jgi:hypothetical protein